MWRILKKKKGDSENSNFVILNPAEIDIGPIYVTEDQGEIIDISFFEVDTPHRSFGITLFAEEAKEFVRKLIRSIEGCGKVDYTEGKIRCPKCKKEGYFWISWGYDLMDGQPKEVKYKKCPSCGLKINLLEEVKETEG